MRILSNKVYKEEETIFFVGGVLCKLGDFSRWMRNK